MKLSGQKVRLYRSKTICGVYQCKCRIRHVCLKKRATSNKLFFMGFIEKHKYSCLFSIPLKITTTHQDNVKLTNAAHPADFAA